MPSFVYGKRPVHAPLRADDCGSSIHSTRVQDIHRDRMLHGANELDLVRSGLGDTMRPAYQEMDEDMRARNEIPDL